MKIMNTLRYNLHFIYANVNLFSISMRIYNKINERNRFLKEGYESENISYNEGFSRKYRISIS